jgi:hypothetical protein
VLRGHGDLRRVERGAGADDRLFLVGGVYC